MGVTEFESLFLNEVRSSFRKKRKSLKHRVGNIEFDRVLIEKPGIAQGSQRERLDVAVDADPTNLLLMKFHDDRWLWVYVRETERREIVFEWESEGRLIDTGAGLLSAVYASILAMGVQTRNARPDELAKAWSKILHSGPVEKISRK